MSDPNALAINPDSGAPSTSFLILCAALVFIMTPGVGLFYSGLCRARNALTLIMLSLLAMAIVSIQWFIFGFSLAFSETSSTSFIGNAAHFVFINVGAPPLAMTAPAVPAIVFALYQLQFAAITPAIIFGSVAERIRLIPAMLFIFIWSTLVYDVIAYWTWGARGWLRNMACLETTGTDAPCGIGAIDFAGSGPVHIASGFAGLAYTLFIGKRKNMVAFKPHNVTMVFLGTALIWFGWFAFNGGSAITSTARAAMSSFVSTLCASFAGLSYLFVDYFKHRKISGVSFCSGAVAGLVIITPASGFVAPWSAAVMGLVGGVAVNFAIRMKEKLGFDDTLDAFGLHGVGGVLGALFTGLFATTRITSLDGATIPGGWVDGNYIQLAYQLAAVVVTAAYSFVVSWGILFVINLIPGCHLRFTPQQQLLGADMEEMGEVAYDFKAHPHSNPDVASPIHVAGMMYDFSGNVNREGDGVPAAVQGSKEAVNVGKVDVEA